MLVKASLYVGVQKTVKNALRILWTAPKVATLNIWIFPALGPNQKCISDVFEERIALGTLSKKKMLPYKAMFKDDITIIGTPADKKQVFNICN